MHVHGETNIYIYYIVEKRKIISVSNHLLQGSCSLKVVTSGTYYRIEDGGNI